MKTPIIFLFAAGIVLASCVNVNSDKGYGSDFFTSKKGTGPITEKTFEGRIDKIIVSTSIKAEVLKSDAEKVVISAPSDIINEVKVENNNGKMHIYVKGVFGKSISTQNVKATIYVKDFEGISADSSADIKVKDTFTQNKVVAEVSSSGSIRVSNLEANELSIEANSSGDFTGKIWAINLKAEASSSGDIAISGKAKNATMEASSSGDIKASDVIVENAILEAFSSGDISVSVSKSLKAEANSSGDITVFKKGDLEQIKTEKNSGGDIYIK